MRYSRVVIHHFCSRQWCRTSTHTHTHTHTHRKPQLGSDNTWVPNRAFFCTFISKCIQKQVGMTVLRSIHVNKYCFRSALYPKPAGSWHLQPLILHGPIAVLTQMHRQWHLLWTQQCFQGHLPPQNVKKCLYYYTGHRSEPTLWRHTLWYCKMVAPLLQKL